MSSQEVSPKAMLSQLLPFFNVSISVSIFKPQNCSGFRTAILVAFPFNSRIPGYPDHTNLVVFGTFFTIDLFRLVDLIQSATKVTVLIQFFSSVSEVAAYLIQTLTVSI